MSTKLQLAQLAIEQYGLFGAELTLSQDLWNTTYCVTACTGQKYNLRLCGAEAQDSKLIHDELTFIDFVASRNEIGVPLPVRNLDGGLVTYVTLEDQQSEESAESITRMCCLFEWIDGEVARDCLTPSVIKKMGSATALLHRAARDFRFPSPDESFRRGYDYDEAVVLQHREWLAERADMISDERIKLINRAIDHLLTQFQDIPKTRENYGFIHADLNPNNFIVTNPGQENETVAVIDFEQLGRGHYAFDLATTLVEFEETRPDYKRLWPLMKAGYQLVDRLPFDDEIELGPFVMTCHLNFLDWIYNTPSPHVRQQYETRFEDIHGLIEANLATAS